MLLSKIKKAKTNNKINKKYKFSKKYKNNKNKKNTIIQHGRGHTIESIKKFINSKYQESKNAYSIYMYDIRFVILYCWVNNLQNLFTKTNEDMIKMPYDEFKKYILTNSKYFETQLGLTFNMSLQRTGELTTRAWFNNNKNLIIESGCVNDEETYGYFFEIIDNDNYFNINDQNFELKPGLNANDLEKVKRILYNTMEPINDNIFSSNNEHESVPVAKSEPVSGSESVSVPVAKSEAKKSHNLTIHWYKNWPDHGVPDLENFNNFLNIMFQNIMDVGGNTVIHCSAGVGRTGVMYICLRIKKWLNDYKNKNPNNPTPNIEEIIERIKLELTNARRSRMWLVQKVEQYIFIHNIFISKLSETELKKITTNYTLILQGIYETVDPKIFTNNRYLNILPYEYNIPWLNDGKHIPENYINASVMINYDDKTNNDDETNYDDEANNDVFGNGMMVITAECPTDNSINNFRQMLLQYNIKRIIMLTNMIENGKLKCNDYTQTGLLTQKSNNNSQSQNYGNGYEIIMFQIPLDMPKMVNSVAGGYRKKNNSHINKNKLNKSRKHIKKYNLL